MEVEDELLIGKDLEEAEEIPPEKVSRDRFLECIEAADNDPLGDLKWVFHALGAEGLKPEDAPSPGAWSLLTSLQGDELMLKTFYTSVYPRLLPNKSQIPEGDERVDDERRHFRLIERLLQEPDDIAPVLSSAEERARELAISGTNS